MGVTQKLGTIPLAILTDASNNVGIGAAPSGSYKLEVTGTAKVSSTLLVSGAATFSSSVTGSNYIANTGSTNTTAYILNRGSSSFDGVLEWQDAGSSRWKVGTFGTGSGDLRFYSAATGGYPLTLSYGTGAATFSNNVFAGGSILTSPSGADTIIGAYGAQDCSLILQDAVQLWELYVNDDFNINRGSTTALSISRTNGNIGIGTSASTVKLYTKSETATSASYAFGCENGSVNLFLVRGDGLIYTGTASLSPYNYGVSGGVALYVGSSGQLGYNSSTRQSKTNIVNIENVEWLKKLTPVNFNKRKVDDDNNYLDEFESELDYGLIAEDVQEINDDMVFSTNDGKLKGVHYDKLIVPILKLVQEQQATITSLQEQINAIVATK